ncbi:MAG: hypothetical protein SWJ54_12760, partial [Cyanobacteriota bacterium]|nr:hypothetical protein [Cyanobacteriota bacterium]
RSPMQININLDEEISKKLAYIQQKTEQDLLDVIQSSIELHYQHLQQTDPLAKFKQSSFIGCFQAEPNLAESSEDILHSIMQEKHDNC